MKRVIIYGALVLAAIGTIVSCQKDGGVEYSDDDLTLFEIFSTTKTGDGGDEEATEVLLTLYQNKNVISSDTYTLDSDGMLTRNNTGIVASDGNYTLFVTTPTDVSLDESNGTKVYRTESDDDVNVYSGYQDITVEGIYSSSTSSVKSYRLDLDLTLKKRVSGLRFTIVSADPENSEYTINKVELSNILKSAYYLPAEKYIAAGTGGDDLESDTYSFLPGGKTDAFEVTESVSLYKDGVSSDDTFMLISGDYTSSLFSNLIPKLTVQFNNDEGKEIDVPLSINFEPQVNYTYSITLASTQINVKVTASDDWYAEYNNKTTVETVAEYTLSYTETEDSWESGGDDTTF